MSKYGAQSEVLRSSGSDVQSCNAEIQEIVRRIDNVIKVGCEAWDGTAMAQYTNNWAQHRKVLTGDLSELLVTLGKQLEAVGNTYEEVDRDIAQKISM